MSPAGNLTAEPGDLSSGGDCRREVSALRLKPCSPQSASNGSNEMKFTLRVFAGITMKATLTLAAVGLAVILTGCAGRPVGVPPFSQLVAQAPSQVASFQAPDDGTVYVAGPGHFGQDRHLTYSGLVRRGEIVTVDPVAGKLLINSKLQDATIDTGGKSYYEIWYSPTARDIVGN